VRDRKRRNNSRTHGVTTTARDNYTCAGGRRSCRV